MTFQTAPDVPDSWVFDYPHMVGILVVMVILNVTTDMWVERHYQEGRDAGPPLFRVLILIPVTLFHGFFVWWLPASLIVGAVQHYSGVPLTPSSYALHYADPSLKLALVFCLIDNYIQFRKYTEPVRMTQRVIEILLLVVLGYPGALLTAYAVAVVLAASGMFGTARFDAARDLFAVPVVFDNSVVNYVATTILGGIVASVAADLILRRARSRKS